MSERRKKGRTKYERLAERVERTGVYDLVEPFDYMILEQLPAEGSMFAGVYEIGASAEQVKKVFPPEITSSMLGGRLNTLGIQGLARKVKTLGSGSKKWSWQRTAAAEKLLEEWKESNGHGN